MKQILDSTNTPVVFAAAGVPPLLLSNMNTVLSIFYFTIIIPPAIYHCWQFFSKKFLPPVRKFFTGM